MSDPTTSVIVPTYNRPNDLSACIASLLAQTLRPTEIIVIDDGRPAGFPHRPECEEAGIRCIYRTKEVPGLTASRNLGIRLASGDVVFFLDDDVVLCPDYIDEIVRVYRECDADGRLGGVGGLIANMPPLRFDNRCLYWLKLFFLTSGLREGRVLRSGFFVDFGTTPFPLRRPTRVDFLSGGVSSFKKRVFDEFAFSDEYRGYGLGEDKEFTWRVSRKYALYVNPAASLDHNEAPSMRYDKRKMGRAFVVFHRKFFMAFLNRGFVSRLWFWYAVTGYLLERILIMLGALGRRGETGRVIGVLSAIAEILGGKSDEKADS
ncbi:glycosyltransferase family 2 protein [Candidatus Sumerlaeota bacterium]|nr:glycosyltransferase family 2 protein [Candidatus Sumerlaeota bacterium]